MTQRNIFCRRSCLVALLVVMLASLSPAHVRAQSSAPGLDIFSGLDFNFRDINYSRQYDLLIHLTPGFKWNMGNHWQLAGQVYIPIVNTYGSTYKYVYLNILDVSKQLRLGPVYLKASAGLFSLQRYGVDLKAFLPITPWLAIEGQVGWVGVLTMSPSWYISPLNRFAWNAGGDIYLSRWNAQLRAVAGRYVYQDFGCEVEAMRHFNHTSASLYGRWSSDWGFDGGFRFVAMLPPYRRKHRAVNFRPASNFRISYSIMYHQYSNRMYNTDPEENERDGWFSRDLLQWGSHTMQPDFIESSNTVTE